jgi:hypothetical protein
VFGLWKEYLYRPSYDPDAFISLEDLYRPLTSPDTVDPQAGDEGKHLEHPPLYSSKSVALLLEWQNTGSSAKSNDKINCLVRSVLLHPEFQPDTLQSFNATRENKKADAAGEQSPFQGSFKCANVDIEVPSGSKDVPPQTFTIPGLYYHKIVTLIKDAFDSHISVRFHLTPFKLFRRLPGNEDGEHMYSEMYNSDAFLDKHDRVQRAPTDNPSCKREKVVVAIMFWSDATHLAVRNLLLVPSEGTNARAQDNVERDRQERRGEVRRRRRRDRR